MELERLEEKEVLTKEGMDLVEFQKNLGHKIICKKIDEKQIEFTQNNNLQIKDILLIKRFCEYMKGR